MGNWALITGASTGIGRELAEVFADNGFNLVLVARDQERLKLVAGELTAGRKIEVKLLPEDLSRPGAASSIFQHLRDTPVAVLVNNAGFGSYGPFVQTSLATETEMMELNMVALVQLTHLFVQPMLARRAGYILNVASTAAFQPGPTMSIYYATKAFVFSFSYALADELKGSGVKVTVLCPGLTRTEFQKRARLRAGGPWEMSARVVAEAGYRGLMSGRRVVIPGVLNRIASFFARRVPFGLTSAVVRRVHRPE